MLVPTPKHTDNKDQHGDTSVVPYLSQMTYPWSLRVGTMCWGFSCTKTHLILLQWGIIINQEVVFSIQDTHTEIYIWVRLTHSLNQSFFGLSENKWFTFTHLESIWLIKVLRFLNKPKTQKVSQPDSYFSLSVLLCSPLKWFFSHGSDD